MALTSVEHAMTCDVGSTKFGKKKKTGVLYVGQHAVLKPIQNCISGRREVDFYNTVFQPQHDHPDDDIHVLREFLPLYMGVEERAGKTHIKLENTISRFRKPCMIDIKMGHVTSDPLADPAKVAQRRSKYPYAEKLGFTLSGMTVYDPDTQNFLKVDKYICHNFTLHQVFVDGLGRFFFFPDHPRKDVIRCLLHKLHKIRRWFLRQRRFAFYASSLLISYDGSQPGTLTETVETPSGVSSSAQANTPQGEAAGGAGGLCRKCSSRSSDSSSNNSSNNSSEHHTGTVFDELDESVNSRGHLMSLVESSKCGCFSGEETVDDSLVDVRLIDFTHAFRTTERDDNYLGGLQTLINVLHIMYNWS